MTRPTSTARKRPSGETWLIRTNRAALERWGTLRLSTYITLAVTVVSISICMVIYLILDVDFVSAPISIVMPIAVPILTAFPLTLMVNRLVAGLMKRERLNERQQQELRQLAQEAAEQRRAAEVASQAKSSLLANMSHELRTPLNAIIGFSDIFQGRMYETLSAEQVQQYASDINVSGRLLLSLVNDLLEIARIEGGGRTFQTETVVVADKVDEVARIVRTQADEAGINLKVLEIAPDLSVETDDRAMRQMLLNLIANAIKFTPKDGTVAIRVEKHPVHVTIAVSDTGIGIDEKELGTVFEPFGQIDNLMTRTKTGTGLGLALVKTMIEQQGGQIKATSVKGLGSTFTLYFPVIQMISDQDVA